jgi:hypothetical protein
MDIGNLNKPENTVVVGTIIRGVRVTRLYRKTEEHQDIQGDRRKYGYSL